MALQRELWYGEAHICYYIDGSIIKAYIWIKMNNPFNYSGEFNRTICKYSL